MLEKGKFVVSEVRSFEPGQVWRMKGRPQDPEPLVLILASVESPVLGTVWSVAIAGVSIPNARTKDGIQEMLPHAPVTQSVLEEGVIDLVADDGPLADDPDFEESYWQWREPFDRGEAGVFTVPLTEILDIVEQAIRSSAN